MWMVFRTGALLLCLTLSTPGTAQTTSDPAVETVIQDQLDAFLRDDFEEAFTFASPMIKNIFRNPETFGAMVRQGYPMVWRPAEVEFGQAETQGPLVFQRVIITDANGVMHVLQYEMIPAGSGWQINGVRLLRAPDLGV